jgi:hypothetical protein
MQRNPTVGYCGFLAACARLGLSALLDAENDRELDSSRLPSVSDEIHH